MNNTEQKENTLQLMTFLTANPIAIANTLKETLQSGEVDLLQAYVSLKKMDKVLKMTIDGTEGDKAMKEMFFNAVEKAKEGNKSIDIYGANLRTQATGTRYDFTECGDTVLNELYKIKAQIDESIKTREAEIKAILPAEDNKVLGIRSKKIIQEGGIPMLSYSDDEFEETIFPPIKRSGTSVICTFKK